MSTNRFTSALCGGVAVLLLGGVLLCEPVSAGVLDLYGASAKSASMGNAVGSYGEGMDSAHFNPATLLRGGDWSFRVEVGYLVARPSLGLDVHGDNPSLTDGTLSERRVATARSYRKLATEPDEVTGFNVGLFFKPAEVFAAGLSLHLPQHRLARERFISPDRPFFLQHENRSQQLVVEPAVAFEVYKNLKAGAALRLFYDAYGGIVGIIPFDTQAAADVRIDLELNADVAFTYGLNWDDRLWGVGLSYREEQISTFSGTEYFETNLGGLLFPLPITIRGKEVFQPRTIHLGGHYDPVKELTVAFGVSWVEWSGYRPPFVRVAIDFPDNIAPVLYPRIYDRNDPEIRSFWQGTDTFVPHFGFEYRFQKDWAWRMGYSFEADPFPQQRGMTNILSGDTHVIGWGLSYSVDKRFFIEVFAQYRGTTIRDVSKNAAFLPDESAAVGLQSANPLYPGAEASATSLAAGLTFTLK